MTLDELTARALAAFGRNDIRGTYRDPLLVMIVLAPVIWTVAASCCSPPLFTETLARRYDFDLVPYYPLVLTAFLLLTSIIIVGGLGGVPRPRRDRRRHADGAAGDAGVAVDLLRLPRGHRRGGHHRLRGGHDVVQRNPRPGLVPALDPDRDAWPGLSAVVTLLLIVAVASNKIQGIAMVRLLGIVIAGLPCLPWFVDSAWNLAFGVLPPYWAAKAFWVASDHGTWWPYLVGGVVYNLAVAWPLFRRFIAKNT